MSCGAGHRRGSDAMWLWQRLADATLIRPLAWELPHATGVALKKGGKKVKFSSSVTRGTFQMLVINMCLVPTALNSALNGAEIEHVIIAGSPSG